MLKNYIKIAIAVLKRRKFFTFISLFGISFTLTILIILTAFLDHLSSPTSPDVNRDRELIVSRIFLMSKDGNSSIQCPGSFHYFDHYVSTMKTPKKLAIYSATKATNAYQNNKKLVIESRYTNAAYWEVYQFRFLEGKPFNQQQVDNGEQVAVISDETRNEYFGEGVSAIGKYIETSNVQYKVIGVVQSVSATNSNCSGGIYLPVSLAKDDMASKSLQGSFQATMLAPSTSDMPKMREEYQQLVNKVPHPGKNQELFFSYADTYMDGMIRELFGNRRDHPADSGQQTFYMVVGIFVFLLMLLPTINLVNVNISRIMERSSEIGVRKAFGASSKTLVGQFIVENLILTLLGGVLGVLFSTIIIMVLNSSGLIPHLDLKMNFTVLFYTLFICVVFGLMSGVYPAWRMSKMNVVKALKAND